MLRIVRYTGRLLRATGHPGREPRVKVRALRLAATWAMVLIGLFTPPRTARGIAQDTPSVWTGVYTAAQAERGKAVYAGRCSRCHGDDLGGNRDYPLAGERFMDHWEAHTLEQLFRRIRDTMPPGEAAAMSDSDKRDAMAYLLQQNGFPPGRAELAQDDQLAIVKITRITGPGPLKTGAIVRVAGCLARRRESDFELTRAAEPERATLDAAPAAERQPPDAVASGTRTVRLLNAFPSPAGHVGHRVQAIGFLVKDAGGDAVNVVSLKMLAPSCAP